MSIEIKEVPHLWAVCFNEKCPMRDECLRYQAARQLPAGKVQWMTVLPSVLKDGECKAYCAIKVERMAYGLGQLYSHVEQQDYKRIKEKVTDYLGGKSTYYRYHRGEKLLSEQQQADIHAIFAHYGYTDLLAFGGYREELQYPWL